MKSWTVRGHFDRLRALFPEREFFMRSNGQVRFIRISARVQIIGAAIVAALLLVWLGSMLAMAVAQFVSTRDRLSLLNREAQVADAEGRVSAYRDDISKVTEDLERRQDFIDKMVGTLPADAKVGETVSDSSSEAQRTIDKVSVALPEAAALARVEARQLSFVERLTRLADRRSSRAAERIRAMGLNPDSMLRQASDRNAQGGPLFSLTTSASGKLDPRFARLGVSLMRMNTLERGLAGIPQVLPASLEFISSGFGYRSDPFTGGAAFHSGLDFRGPTGAPVFAAAKGVVSHAGYRAGYGNSVEIDHGNGLMTRYAHLSAFRTQVGKQIAAGSVIGAIGSTGRSTGPHLHFEVRINDRPVNPRPFLEAAPHVLEKASGTSAPQHD